jgi:branched-chain amino acid transport system substrate-binding protein
MNLPRSLRPASVFFAAALTVLAGCSKAPPVGTTATIKVGEIASLTGKEATFGQSSHKGTLLAIEELNAAGGVLGRPFELVTEDNQSKQGESATAARKLLSRDKVVALLGEVASSRSLEIAPVAQAAKIPMVSPASTNPKVTETGDYIFRVCFIDPFQGTVMAKFAASRGWKKVAVLSSASSAYSVGLAKYFTETYAAGGTLVADQKYAEGDKDFKAQLTAIKAAAPDAIFVPGYYTECALIAKQARELGLAVPLFGGDGWESESLLTIGGAAVEGVFFSTHYAPDNATSAVAAFVKKYKARWNNETPDAMAALGYDSAMVLADAMKRAGTTDAAQLRDALAATKAFAGVTGQATMDANRNAIKSAAIVSVKNGKFTFVQEVAP